MKTPLFLHKCLCHSRMFLSGIQLFVFLLTSIGPIPANADDDLHLPAPGVMVNLSLPFDPPILKGIKVHPENPFRFEFILDSGDESQGQPGDMTSVVSPSRLPSDLAMNTKATQRQKANALKQEANKLIKYFLVSLTIPEKDLWVNLSPYEKDRIIPQSFGLTEMGRDLLAEDYMLKQITASLIYPEGETGRKFWKRIYEEADKKFGTTNIPVNTFNKVWIVPDKAVVYENAKAGTAYVVESKLKVMLEQDYLSLEKHEGIQHKFVILSVAKDLKKINSIRDSSAPPQNDINALGSQVIREIVIPELTREVNEDKNFVQLRQVYNSLILATWYKKKIKDSILEQVYADKNKVKGVGYNKNNMSSPKASVGDPQYIYQQYLRAFKKGVYSYIKEDVDPVTQENVPRKYFSGGVDETLLDMNLKTTSNAAMLAGILGLIKNGVKRFLNIDVSIIKSDANDWTASNERIPGWLFNLPFDHWSRMEEVNLNSLPAGSFVRLIDEGSLVNYQIEVMKNGRIKLWANAKQGCFIGPISLLKVYGPEIKKSLPLGILQKRVGYKFPYFRWNPKTGALMDYKLLEDPVWVHSFTTFMVYKPSANQAMKAEQNTKSLLILNSKVTKILLSAIMAFEVSQAVAQGAQFTNITKPYGYTAHMVYTENGDTLDDILRKSAIMRSKVDKDWVAKYSRSLWDRMLTNGLIDATGIIQQEKLDSLKSFEEFRDLVGFHGPASDSLSGVYDRLIELRRKVFVPSDEDIKRLKELIIRDNQGKFTENPLISGQEFDLHNALDLMNLFSALKTSDLLGSSQFLLKGKKVTIYFLDREDGDLLAKTINDDTVIINVRAFFRELAAIKNRMKQTNAEGKLYKSSYDHLSDFQIMLLRIGELIGHEAGGHAVTSSLFDNDKIELFQKPVSPFQFSASYEVSGLLAQIANSDNPGRTFSIMMNEVKNKIVSGNPKYLLADYIITQQMFKELKFRSYVYEKEMTNSPAIENIPRAFIPEDMVGSFDNKIKAKVFEDLKRAGYLNKRGQVRNLPVLENPQDFKIQGYSDKERPDIYMSLLKFYSPARWKIWENFQNGAIYDKYWDSFILDQNPENVAEAARRVSKRILGADIPKLGQKLIPSSVKDKIREEYFSDVIKREVSSHSKLVQAGHVQGGIDLTAANMNVQVKMDSRLRGNDIGRSGNDNGMGEIRFHLNPAQLAQLQNAPGFVPEILSISPMRDLKKFLEVTTGV